MDGRICIFILQENVWRICVSAKKYPNMAKEFMLKALLYNIFESIKM
jgi:hypothetical protein